MFMSLSSFTLMCNTLLWFKSGFSLLCTLVCLTVTLVLFNQWFRDIARESAHQGHHTALVQGGLKWGLIWFLFSEIWFFFSVFWGFFHTCISPITGGTWYWPNFGVETIPAFQVPLLNTIILLMSGLTATLAHMELLKGEKTIWVIISAILGSYFLLLQGAEYFLSSFCISSGVYGSIFFFGTGFHGLHVCLGMLMLMVSSMRIIKSNLSSHHHFGLEFSLWYWHFVDVVWIFLFFFVYTWGS